MVRLPGEVRRYTERILGLSFLDEPAGQTQAAEDVFTNILHTIEREEIRQRKRKLSAQTLLIF
ncbi:MAG: hypothetical protein V3T60_03865 [Candidatus Binatia bacterium]